MAYSTAVRWGWVSGGSQTFTLLRGVSGGTKLLHVYAFSPFFAPRAERASLSYFGKFCLPASVCALLIAPRRTGAFSLRLADGDAAGVVCDELFAATAMRVGGATADEEA